MKNTSYKKKNSQITLENTLISLKERHHLTSISQLKNEAPLKDLYDQFMLDLSNVVLSILNESKIHNLVNSIAVKNNNEYYKDVHQYAFFYEACSETLLSLFDTINKKDSKNYGRVRIDVLFDEPETFVKNLRYFIKNGILLDTARRYETDVTHKESITTTKECDDDAIVNKLDSMKYNKFNISNGFNLENTVISQLAYEPDLCQNLITAVIDRFGKRKPVAAFLYGMIMLDMYDTTKVIEMLTKTSDFNNLMHTLLHAIELAYPVDLSMYKDVEFNADKYLTSLKSLSNQKALRDRIDRLTSDTRKIVHNLQVYKETQKKYVAYSQDRKTYRL